MVPCATRRSSSQRTAGVTAGGDKIDQVSYKNGETQNIRAGNLITTGAGVSWRPEESDFSLQLTANYHFDTGYGNNGTARFDRFPIELMAFYDLHPHWRIGLGGRRVISPKYRYDVGPVSYSRNFKDTFGAVAEVGFMITPQAILSLRYVKEEYEEENPYGPGQKIDGSHVGFNGTYIF